MTPRSAITGKVVRISPSAYSAFHGCQMQWWLGYVARLRGPSGEAQTMGIGIHAVGETYLKGVEQWDQPAYYASGPGKTDRVTITDAHIERFEVGIPNLPEPGTVGVEEWVKTRAGPLPFVGQVDMYPLVGLVHEQPTPYHPTADWWIADHKSTSSFYWAKSSSQLANNLQMMAYAYAAYHDLPGGPPETVGLTHLYYLTKYTEPKRCKKCEGQRAKQGRCTCGPRALRVDSPPVPWSKIKRRWERTIIPTAEEMAPLIEVADMGRIATAKNPQKKCREFKHGCDYARNGVCPVGRRVLGTQRPSLVGLPYDLPDTVIEAAGLQRPAPAALPAAATGTGTLRLMRARAALEQQRQQRQQQRPSPQRSDDTMNADELTPTQRKMFGLPPLPAAAPPATPTPVRAQVLEAVDSLKNADAIRAEAGMEPCSDALIVNMMGRLRLPTDAATLAQVKGLARGAAGVVDATPKGGKGPAGAVDPPMPPAKVDKSDLIVAEEIRDLLADRAMVPFSEIKAIMIRVLNQKKPRKNRATACLQIGVDRGWFLFDPDVLKAYNVTPAAAEAIEARGKAIEAGEITLPPEPAEGAEPTEGTEPVTPETLAEAVEPATPETLAGAVEQGQPVEVAVQSATPGVSFDGPIKAAEQRRLDRAPAPQKLIRDGSTPALPNALFIAYVGCMPIGTPPDTTLSLLIADLEQEVADENDIAHYLLRGFRKGQVEVAAMLHLRLQNRLADGSLWEGWRTIYVDPEHPAAREALAVLEQLPQCLVIRAVR